MTLQLLLAVPFAAAVLALIVRSGLRLLLVGTALAHLALTLSLWLRPAAPAWRGWLEIDELGLLFLTLTSVLFCVASWYATAMLGTEKTGRTQMTVFVTCMLCFVGAMTLVPLCRHLGLLWVAVEATTLAPAPLIYFHRDRRSLEATWKFLMVCSVGIALALLGSITLAVATQQGGRATPLVLETLLRADLVLDPPWLSASFIFLLVGYGTKMGLAPLHTWLPDAHSEAPAPVSALLSGALLNCSLLALLRGFQVCLAKGQGDEARVPLLALGFVSLGVAAAFIPAQRDYKRLLAYSSVEHMGVIAVGLGLGGQGTYGALLHTLHHALTKGLLFLVAGTILSAYRTKDVSRVSGLLRATPVSGALWLAGFVAIVGLPPFGLFFSELFVLKAALGQGRVILALLYLALLLVIFIGMARIVIGMAFGEPSEAADRERPALVTPALVLGLIVLVLGVYLPAPLRLVLEAATRVLGGMP